LLEVKSLPPPGCEFALTMYYMELELRIREKRGREMRPASLHVTHFKDYGPGIIHEIYSLGEATRQT
jgi:hypothetical protein